MVVQLPPLRPYVIGDVAYKVLPSTSSTIVKLVPVTWADSTWVPSQFGKVLFRDKSFLKVCQVL